MNKLVENSEQYVTLSQVTCVGPYVVPEVQNEEDANFPPFEYVCAISDYTADPHAAGRMLVREYMEREGEQWMGEPTEVTQRDVVAMARAIPVDILQAYMDKTLTLVQRRILDRFFVREYYGFMLLEYGFRDAIDAVLHSRRTSLKLLTLQELVDGCGDTYPSDLQGWSLTRFTQRCQSIVCELEDAILESLASYPIAFIKRLRHMRFSTKGEQRVRAAGECAWAVRVDPRKIIVKELYKWQALKENTPEAIYNAMDVDPNIFEDGQDQIVSIGPLSTCEPKASDWGLAINSVTCALKTLYVQAEYETPEAAYGMQQANDFFATWSLFKECKVRREHSSSPLYRYGSLMYHPENPCGFTLRHTKDGLIRTYRWVDMTGVERSSVPHYVGVVPRWDCVVKQELGTRAVVEMRYREQEARLKVRSLNGAAFQVGLFSLTENEWRERGMVMTQGQTMALALYETLWETALCMSARNTLVLDVERLIISTVRSMAEYNEVSRTALGHTSQLANLGAQYPNSQETSRSIMESGLSRSFVGPPSFVMSHEYDGFAERKTFAYGVNCWLAVRGVPQGARIRISHTLPSLYHRAYTLPIDVDRTFSPWGDLDIGNGAKPYGFMSTDFTVYNFKRSAIPMSIDMVWVTISAKGFFFCRPVQLMAKLSFRSVRWMPMQWSTPTDIASFQKGGIDINDKFISYEDIYKFMNDDVDATTYFNQKIYGVPQEHFEGGYD